MERKKHRSQVSGIGPRESTWKRTVDVFLTPDMKKPEPVNKHGVVGT